MAANLSQPAFSTSFLLMNAVAVSKDVVRHSLEPQHLAFASSSAGLGLCEAREVFWVGSNVGAQEASCRQVSRDGTRSLDQRLDKKSSSSSDFRHREPKESFPLCNFGKRARVVQDQRTVQDVELYPPRSSSGSILSLNPIQRRVLPEYNCDISGDLISKLCAKGQLGQAVDSLATLVHEVPLVSTSLFYTVLRGCVLQKNLGLGRRVHELIVQGGHESNVFLANHVLRMYASHGRLQEVMEVFTKLDKPNTFSWCTVISVHAKHGEPMRAVELYQKMRSSGMRPNSHVFVAALQACARAANLDCGRQVHGDVLESGIERNLFICSCLVDMYAKCGRLEDARRVFDGLATKDVVTWNAMIAGYAQLEHCQDALHLYEKMEETEGVKANSVTFACLLRACARVGALQQGKQLHSRLADRGLEGDTLVGTCLVDMYAKCGSLEDSRKIFDKLASKDVVAWNAMIAGYSEHWHGREALALYAEMEHEGHTVADPVTLTCLLKACAGVGDLVQAKQLHSKILERGLIQETSVANSLLDMYAKCGRLEDARTIFDNLGTRDVITWTTMICGYAGHERGEEALCLYQQMESGGLILADSVTFACLLKICGKMGALEQGKQLHSQILERGLAFDLVLGTSLVDMYAKCGRLEDARSIFDMLPSANIVTWNAMIAGYSKYGLGEEALALYARMDQECAAVPDSVTYYCLLKACATVAALQQGKQLHAQIVERGMEKDVTLGNCLLDMYAKCGRLEEARRIFDSLDTKDVVTWTMMIDGFGQSNESLRAIECFQEMTRHGVQPDETTFTCLLVACSHEGLVKEGQQFFKAMVEEWGIVPTVEHYTCMVDLFGRAGCLEEAEKLLMSFESDDVAFMSLLTACKSHRDVKRGERCFEALVRADSQNAAAYMLMQSIYADAGRWSEVERIERLRKAAGAAKKSAVAGIEVGSHVHTFCVGDDKGDTPAKVRRISNLLKEDGGLVPQTELVLNRLIGNDKEDQLCGHAEKLALAFGLLNTPDGSPLLVTKNLRMCGDCHSSTEVMSRIENREIVVRDAHRVHRFVNGSCGCGGRP